MTLSHADVERALDAAFEAVGIFIPDGAAVATPERTCPPKDRVGRINAAVECAKRGMNRSETARHLGMGLSTFYKFHRANLNDVKFSSHRARRKSIQ